jgi:hypothetical protein
MLPAQTESASEKTKPKTALQPLNAIPVCPASTKLADPKPALTETALMIMTASTPTVADLITNASNTSLKLTALQ